MRDVGSRGTSWAAATTAACIACFFSGFGFAEDKPEKKDSLAGTTWSGRDSRESDYAYTFEPDGTLSYNSPTGSFKNGKWKQFGNAVYFEMNDHYSEYLGEVSGQSIKGRAWNSKGLAWEWKATKDK